MNEMRENSVERDPLPGKGHATTFLTNVGDAPRLWGLIAAELWRRFRCRLRSGPAWRWRFAGRTPDRVLIAPPDLRLADPQIATEIYHGRFPLAGHLVETGGKSPFQLEVANHAWCRSLHSFRWLLHMRAAGTGLASANARALVSDWIAIHGRRITRLAWEPATTARRIIAWLQHSSVVLQDSEYPFYRAFLKSLAVQVRYLRSVVDEMPCDAERLRARVALVFAALSLPVSASTLRLATRNLSQDIELQILPDGGHISRNPADVLELLTDFLPLRHTYANQAEAPPPALIAAIERMMPALRFFRHQDGSLAHFNGMGVTTHDRIAAILRHDDSCGAPLLHATHSGFERLSAGNTTVIADTGAPPPAESSNNAHAGCLSFELSSNRQLFIVNCGIDNYGAEDFRPLARATAAHSTAVLNDTSSARFSHSARINDLIGRPLVGGPKAVCCERFDQNGKQGFIASHDGYVSRFGLYHEREVALSNDGEIVDGADRFFTAKGGIAPGKGLDLVAVRFHIHPDVSILQDEEGCLILAARGADSWAFEADNIEPSIEESIFFAGLSGPRRSRQIVLFLIASERPEIRWRLTRIRA